MNAITATNKKTIVFLFAICVATAYWTITATVHRQIGYSILISDQAGYAQWSHDLVGNAVYYHLPGYPATIAVARILTFSTVDDATLMQLTCLFFWLGGLWYFDRLLGVFAPTARIPGLILYAFFPHAGIADVVTASSGPLLRLLLVGAFWYAASRQWWRWAAFAGFCLIVNKGAWPVIGLMTLVCIWQYRLPWRYAILAYVPLTAYYMVLVTHYHDWLWIVRPHLSIQFTAKSKWLLMDGIFGTLMQGTLVNTGKGLLLLGVFAVAVSLNLWLLRKREWLLLAVNVPVLIYGLTLNQQESLSTVRFAFVLVVPFCMWLTTRLAWLAIVQRPSVLIAMTIMLLGFQVFWSAYEVHWYREKIATRRTTVHPPKIPTSDHVPPQWLALYQLKQLESGRFVWLTTTMFWSLANTPDPVQKLTWPVFLHAWSFNKHEKYH